MPLLNTPLNCAPTAGWRDRIVSACHPQRLIRDQLLDFDFDFDFDVDVDVDVAVAVAVEGGTGSRIEPGSVHNRWCGAKRSRVAGFNPTTCRGD